MTRREIIGSGAALLVAGGFTAAFAGWKLLGGTLVLIGALLLFYLYSTATTVVISAEPKKPSAFISGGRIGTLIAKDVTTNAHHFIEDSKINSGTLDRIRHTPRADS